MVNIISALSDNIVTRKAEIDLTYVQNISVPILELWKTVYDVKKTICIFANR